MELIKAVVHRLNSSENQLIFMNEIDLSHSEHNEILCEIVKCVLENKNKTSCIFDSDNQILGLVEEVNRVSVIRTPEDIPAITEDVFRLKEAEIAATVSMRNLMIKNIHPGAVFHMLVSYGDKRYLIICKTEVNAYVAQADFSSQMGFSKTGAKVFKSFYCELTDNGFTDSYIIENGSTHTKYWTETYIGAKLKFDKKKNTARASKKLDSIIRKRCKKSERDANKLIDRHVNYFHQKTTFKLEEYIEDVVRNYCAFSDTISKDDIISEMEGLTDNKRFDTMFPICKDSFEKSRVYDEVIDNDIKLRTSLSKNTLKSRICATDLNGIKGVFIKSEAGHAKYNNN